MAYGGFKDLAKRTASDKVLRDKAINIAKTLRGRASWLIDFLRKKPKGYGVATLANRIT